MKTEFYRWSEALCTLYPAAGPIATMMAIHAVHGHRVTHINTKNPILWLYGPYGGGKSIILREINQLTNCARKVELTNRYDQMIDDLATKLRLNEVNSVLLDDLSDHMLDRYRGEREHWTNLITMLHGRTQCMISSSMYPELSIPTRGFTASLLVASHQIPQDHSVLTRCVLVKLETAEPNSNFNGLITDLRSEVDQAYDDLLAIDLVSSQYNRASSITALKQERSIYKGQERVVENYATLLSLYTMIRTNALPFDHDRLKACLQDAMLQHMPLLDHLP